jgi:hypothetical protein
MIVKYISNPKVQSSKASRIGSLLDYIEADGRADAQKAEYIGASGNFYSDSQQGLRAEMVALAMEATRSKDPVDHWLLSWKEGEQPTHAQCKEAVEILKRNLGMNGNHLAVFALHRNTENYHLHVVLNRVDPVTMRVTDKGWCIDKAHKAIAEIVHAQGWEAETNARYLADRNGEVTRTSRVREQQPRSKARDHENATGEKSCERIAMEKAAPILRSAKSWTQVHEALAQVDMRYERKGSGALLWVAERRIAEKSHRGVVCYISNFSYLSEPSYVVMRKRLLNGFDALWFDCLNGDSRETGKLTPEGKPDPSVFSTDSNREGIRVGTAIALMIRRDKAKGDSSVHYRELWGTRKREELIESLQDTALESRYAKASPTHANRYSFQPQLVSAAYSEWPKITDLCAESPSNGLMEKRGGALIDCDREKLEERMRLYHDKSLDWDAYRLASSTLTGEWARFDARKARARALDAGFRSEQIVRYAVRPFDTRWCYYSDARPIWNEPRPALWAQRFEGNSFLLTRMRCTASPEGFPFSFSKCLSDDHYIIPDAVAVPFLLRHPATSMFASEQTDGNISQLAIDYLQSISLENCSESASSFWLHVLSIGYSPAYLEENADGIRQDWPRIPLPSLREQFKASAALGQRVADLLDTEKPLAGVTAGALRPELRSVAGLKRMDGKQLDTAEDLQLTAGWGHAGKEGVTMPGRGKLVSRERTPKELAELTKGLAALGILQDEGLARLGSTVVDVYLNDLCAWTNVPEKVWELYIGGYQVMKKWLSYREFSFLKRPLTLAEAEEVQAMARRLTALCLLQPELDANYLKTKSATWQGRLNSQPSQEPAHSK